jgi:ribonuclease BN (tRNA processing enzyme)
LLCRWDQSIEQNQNLKVFGPPPTKLITEGLIGKQGIFSYDLIARINHPISKSVHVNRGGRLPRVWPSINVEDIHPESIIENEFWKITSVLAEHVEPYLVSLAYKIEANETSVVFTGDTKPCESVINISKYANVLVANCTREKRDTGLDIVSSAKLAQESGVEKLILTHIGPKLAMPDSRVRACKKLEEIYEGDIIFSDELMKITI